MAQIIHDLNSDDKTISYSEKEKFALDVLVGLTCNPKYIPAIYHYDSKGSHIFDRITKLPEYYPTTCEMETLDRNKEKIAEIMEGVPYNLVEFGSGNGSKTKIIIDTLIKRGIDF